MLGMTEHTRDAYLRVKRPGRGVRLNRLQRAATWSVIEAFTRSVAAQGRTTFELLAARAAEILTDPVSRASAPTYDHVVVDEGSSSTPLPRTPPATSGGAIASAAALLQAGPSCVRHDNSAQVADQAKRDVS